MYIKMRNIIGIHYYGNIAYLCLTNSSYIELDETETCVIEQLIYHNEMNSLIEILHIKYKVKNRKIIKKVIVDLLLSYEKYFFIEEEYCQNIDIRVSGEKKKCFPAEMVISLTNCCAQKCIHCYKNANIDPVEINTNDLRMFLEYIQGKVPEVQLTGGEPFLYTDIVEIINDFPQIIFSVTSSGFFFKQFESNIPKNLKFIQISLYSSMHERHDEFTQVLGSFEFTVETIKKIENLGITVIISSLLLPNNLEKLDEFVQFCIDLKVPYVTFGKVGSMGRATGKDELFLGSAETKRAIKILSELNLKYNGKIQILLGETEENAENIKKNRLFSCLAGRLSWSITESGAIYPCSFFQVQYLESGNISEKGYIKLFEPCKESNLLQKRWYRNRNKLKKFFRKNGINVETFCNNIRF